MDGRREQERVDLLRRAVTLRDEINQIFLDANHWNSLHPQDPIDVDPDGELEWWLFWAVDTIASLEGQRMEVQ